MVQHGAKVPPYRQLADLLREDIRSGKLASGTRLPSIVELGATHGVTTNTVQKALRVLKAEGLVESVGGYGTFVA
jgi:DNA-binding GntR family transcriptional regulator